MKNQVQPLIILAITVISYAMTYCQEKLEVEGAVIIGDSEDPTPVPGTIRWTGTDFEGWNGQRWVSLTGYATVGSVTDIDGNTYQTARIGNQEWMIENLRVTKYNDNTVIDQITNGTTWMGLVTGAWCWNDNNSTYDIPYGKLYNWYAVNTGTLCPTGWHVPSDVEWTVLIDYLGGLALAGGKMKETGTTHWMAPNSGATNESGFAGLPGGGRYSNGTFIIVSDIGWWWSSMETSSDKAWHIVLYHNFAFVNLTSNVKKLGMSVRCAKD